MTKRKLPDMQHDPKAILDEEVFTKVPRIVLADVLKQVEVQYTGTQLRDARSAFRVLSERASIDLSGTIATAKSIREIFDRLHHVNLGVSQKRLANIRSSVTKAVEAFGQPRTWVTRQMPLVPEWTTLLDNIPEREWRWGLNRLACYCSAKGIAPSDVASDTLIGFRKATDAEAAYKDPRLILKVTINRWNRCRKAVPGWPGGMLTMPGKREPYMMPLEAFPQSFQDDVAAWEERMRAPDVLDSRAPVRAYRPDTLQGYRYTFRRLASALVRSSRLRPEDIRDLAVFLDEAHLKVALRPFLKGERVKTEGYAYRMASHVVVVGKHHFGLDEETLAPVKAIADRLKPQGGHVMGARNRARLEQFDDEEVVQRLLAFPEQELARALARKRTLHRSKGVERAFAVSLAIFTGLRVKNLRQLRIPHNIRRSGRRVFVRISEEEAKTHAPLELELPPECIALLDLFIAEHRGTLPASESDYLFPGERGGPRSYDAMRHALSDALWRHAGIRMSPHLYRHAIAKIVVERHPELVHDVSRRLGHKSINTTYQSYLGTEGPAASRRVNTLLQQVRDDGSGASE